MASEQEQQATLRQLIVECQHGQVDYVELMLTTADPLETYHSLNTTALVTAIEYDQLAVTQKIVDHILKTSSLSEEEDVQQRKNREAALRTAFRVCCYNDRVEHADLLLEHRLVRDTDMALDLAATHGSRQVVEYLLQRESTLTAPFDWVSATVCSARAGHRDIVRLLVETLQSRQREWDQLEPTNRFVLSCAAGKEETVLQELTSWQREQTEVRDRVGALSNSFSMGFALSVSCGHSHLACAILEACESWSVDGDRFSINVSVEDNLAARAASILNLSQIMDAILSHSTYVPTEEAQFDPTLRFAKLVDLDRLTDSLTQWTESRRAFPRCQDLSEDMFVEASECSVWFICHRWSSEAHPDVDPTTGQVNRQLIAITKFLQGHRQKYCSCRRLRSQCSTHSGDSDGSTERIGLFYDYMSLPQQPRSPIDAQAFKNGLNELDSLATQANFLALSPPHSVDEFLHRAWCYVEICLALDLGGAFKYNCFIDEESPDTVNDSFAWQALLSSRSSKEPQMAHSNHIVEKVFRDKGFQCTNEDDFSTLARLLRFHLQEAERRNSRQVRRRLVDQQLIMLTEFAENRRRFMLGLSFDQKQQHARIQCAALSAAILRRNPDNHEMVRDNLEKAVELWSDIPDEMTQMFDDQLRALDWRTAYQAVYVPLHVLASQENEEALDATRQRFLEDMDEKDEVRRLVLDLIPVAALMLLSLVQSLP